LDAYFHPFAPNTLHDIASCIKKLYSIYEVDPLTCPKCSGTMKVISVIEDQDLIRKLAQRFTCMRQADKSSNTWDYGMFK